MKWILGVLLKESQPQEGQLRKNCPEGSLSIVNSLEHSGHELFGISVHLKPASSACAVVY
jgi:hypothetical protein